MVHQVGVLRCCVDVICVRSNSHVSTLFGNELGLGTLTACTSDTEGFLNRLADLVLDLLGLLFEIGVPFLCPLPLLLGSALCTMELSFQVSNPGLCSLELLFKQNYLVFMTPHQLSDTFLVLLINPLELTVKFVDEELLQLLFFVSHRLLMVLRIHFTSLELHRQFFLVFFDLSLKSFYDLVQIGHSFVKTIGTGLSLVELLV